MSYGAVKSLIETNIRKYEGELTFGYGTRNELNQPNLNYPVAWLFLPISVTDSAVDADTARQERYPVTIGFYSVIKNSQLSDETDQLFEQMKFIGDGFYYTLLNQPQTMTIGPVVKKQIWKTSDSVLVGWEYSFNIDYYPDVDNCCLAYAS